MNAVSNQLDPHTWVKSHADYLYAYTIKRISDDEQAKDLVQETFLAALEKVDKFEGKSSERTWLTAILKNKIIDVYRKKSSGLRTRIAVIPPAANASSREGIHVYATSGLMNPARTTSLQTSAAGTIAIKTRSIVFVDTPATKNGKKR